MHGEDLTAKIEKFILSTGYPFEQRVAHLLREHGWVVFSSVEYIVPPDQQRELDILCYKIINRRRIELRISCKQSSDKHWIFFTEKNRYLKSGSALKFTPVQIENYTTYRTLPEKLKSLLLYQYDRHVTNFTAFSEKKQHEARLVIKDGLLSVINSVYHRIFPAELIYDERGTIYFFITLFNGLMFESYYDPESDNNIVQDIEYTQWKTEYKSNSHFEEILKYDGTYVPYHEVLRNFSERFTVEVMKWSFFERYLNHIETIFTELEEETISIFGKPYEKEFFPNRIIGKPLTR
ncbi:hypothetical protein [Paenibacillus sp. MER 99-2]|uniref:hypothetical protein n=1 Tax=Paenibacillus sp. MER 99-2 TaxID=2939572 RepID=UPI00203D8A9E|nr:hypothetical protein [Paenibacillus sp. MER 99-2]MCM3172896.1 hypothetical protein [Paenibacillus sp. MER 99-2]